jgi:GAF domain-containing protein
MPTEPIAATAESVRLAEGQLRIARALAERLPAVDTLPIIAEEAAAAVGASTLVVATLEELEYLRFAFVAGDRAHELQGVRVRAAESVAERALRTGTSTIQPGTLDVLSDIESTTAEPPHLPPSVAVVPIEREGCHVGALLAMGSEFAEPNDEEALNRLSLFAAYAAAALALDCSERDRADQARELSVLYKASRSVGASLNLHVILDSVLDAVCDHLDYQTAVVFLANDEQSHLFVAAERGLPEQDRDIQLSAESPIVAQLFATGRSRILLRTDAQPEFDVLVRDERIRAAMIAPVLSRAERHGVLVVTSSQPENFTENDLTLLGAVAAHAGTAISNAWLYEDAMQRAEHAGALYDLSQGLNATLNSKLVHELAVDSAVSLLNVDTGALLLFDERTGRLTGQYARGPHAEALIACSVRPGEGLAGWVFEWETPQSVAQVAADPRNVFAPLDGIASVLVVPMATREKVLGVLLAATEHRRLFTVGEMELLYTVANQAAVSLSNAELYVQARTKSAEMRRYFRRVARALGETMQGEDVPALFADLALAMTRGAICNVYRLEKDVLKLVASATDRAALSPDDEVPLGTGLTGLVGRKGQNVVIEDLSKEPRVGSHPWTSRQRFVSYLGVPLRIQKGTRGVVEVYVPEAHSNMREETRLLAHFARLAKVADRLPE